jgi:fructose-specific phosphotransferase system IIC component
MDGFARSIGDVIAGLMGGALSAIGQALSGMVDALSAALPAGVLPVLGIGLVAVILWRVIRR